MSAGKYNTVIEQGSVFRRILVWKDKNGAIINLTGYSAELQIRKSKNSPTILHRLSSVDGGITITPLQGKIELYISAEDTTELDFGSAYFDLELNPGDPANKKRLIEGIISLSREVTKDEDES